MTTKIENTEVTKKRRGRPKKTETLVEIPVDTSVVKKKRGRPRKVSIYGNFSESIMNLFNNYISDNTELFNKFINNDENRIPQVLWNKINDHIKLYISKLEEKDFFISSFGDYSYKPNSSWRTLDSVIEESRKKCVKEILNESAITDEIYRAYIIFNHLKIYISETSKGSKN